MQGKVALIGLSGSGKSTCVKQFCGLDKLKVADMDCGLGTEKSPDLDNALSWIVNNSENVLAISVHLEMLKEFIKEKQSQTQRLNSIFFVYLFVSKTELNNRLLKPNAYGNFRGDPTSILNDFEMNDALFRSLQDKIIDTTNKEVEGVILEIQSLLN